MIKGTCCGQTTIPPFSGKLVKRNDLREKAANKLEHWALTRPRSLKAYRGSVKQFSSGSWPFTQLAEMGIALV
jgi:hypothetical protein